MQTERGVYCMCYAASYLPGANPYRWQFGVVAALLVITAIVWKLVVATPAGWSRALATVAATVAMLSLFVLEVVGLPPDYVPRACNALVSSCAVLTAALAFEAWRTIRPPRGDAPIAIARYGGVARVISSAGESERL